jgi:hypothetical protein
MYMVVVELLGGVAFQEYSYSGVANLKGNLGPGVTLTVVAGRNRWDTDR